MNHSSDDFVKALASTSDLSNVFNPWRDRCRYDADPDAPARRRANLQRYLTQRVDRARLVLVAEAPGYQGCHFSGIAMTSERILLRRREAAPADAIAPIRLVDGDDVFHGDKQRTSSITCPCAGEQGANEPTATVVWNAILASGLDPYQVVLWNAFAFHPHRPGEPLSNRTPTRSEIAAGEPLLEQLLALFPGAIVGAVGRVAEHLLGARAQITLRHPSMGGAGRFRQQLMEWRRQLVQ